MTAADRCDGTSPQEPGETSVEHAAGHGPVELTEPELMAWGQRIGAGARTPLVLALRGELGAGKSVLARAVARGAGVVSPMPSPTFNLLFSYAASDGVSVHHLDLYRLGRPADVWELGWAELGRAREIVLVEWPERAESVLPEDRWDVYLEHVAERPHVRCVRLVRRGRPPDIPLPRS